MTPYPGMDMSSLQQLMQQFQPSDADRKSARGDALLTLGLGLLGARKGFEMDRLGQAGLLAANTYQQRVQQAQQQRSQNIQQAVQLQNLMRQQQLMKTAYDALYGGQAGSAPAAPIPAGAVGGTGMGGGTAATFGPSSQPGPVASSAPATPMQGMSIPTWKQLAPPEAKAMAAASGDPKVIIDLINKYSETKNGPNGLVTTFDGRPLYQSTESGVQLFDPDTRMPAQFLPYPQASTDAAAKRTAAIEGAKAGATEAAQFPYRTGSRTEPSGATTTGFLSDLYGMPSTAPQSAPFPSGRTISLNFPNGISPTEQAAVQRDIQASGYPQMGYTMAGAGNTRTATGPSPIALEAAKSAIQTNQAINTKVGDTVVSQLDKSYEPAYDAATKTIPQMQEARAILDSGKVITGAAGNFQLEFGRWLSAAGMGGDDYVANTQAFMANQAKQVMSVVKQLGSGSGISNSDREYAAKAQGGQITANEESIRRILDIGERASRLLIQSHNARVDKVAGTFPRADLVNQMHVPMPELYSPTTSARGQMVGPDGQSQPAPSYAPNLKPPPNNELIMGKQAIRNGADPAAVRKRMIERGFDPSGL